MPFLKSYSSFILFSFITLFSNNVLADVISDTTAPDIQEPAGTYDSGLPTLLNMFAKIVLEEGGCTTESYDGCTLNDVLNDIDAHDDFKPEVKVHLTADDFPDDGLISNAKIRQRGDTSRSAPQKSFRIKLDSKDDLWRGERRIQLIKSFYELSRVRNKLSFDLFAEIPHLPSMRTQFVNLTLEDQGVSQNLGMYTSVEHFGKEYLVRRGWDKDSRVYKAEHFYFQNRPEFALDEEGEPVDIDEFEKFVEIKRGDTHLEFVEMVGAVNNFSSDFSTQVFEKYFNQDNYLTWFAVNILVNNVDTDAHNYYLYNPIDTENFYFVPWDYDYAWGASLESYDNDITSDHHPRWWYSHAYWWSNNLHGRFLDKSGNKELLKQAVTEIKNKYLTPEKIAAKRDSYYDVIFPLVSSSPDWDFIYLSGADPERVAAFNQVFSKLSNNVEENYEKFLDRANDPMPFYMADPIFLDNHNINFNWDESVSLSNQAIIYDLEISTTKLFELESIIRTVSNITETNHWLEWTHPKGTYYFRVIARDAANPLSSWQVSYDGSGLEYANGTPIYGIKEFFVSEDGGTTPPPSDDDVSNPVLDSSIIIDGSGNDWQNITTFPVDANDIANDDLNRIDWESVATAHSDDNVFFLYKNHGPIDPNNPTGNFIPWGWQTYIDTDNNPNTGFKLSSVLGADYMIEGSVIQRYNGTGSSWTWDVVGNASDTFVDNVEEFSFPRSWIGNPQKMKIAFQGANEAYGGQTVDSYPDNLASIGYFSYSFGDSVTPPSNTAPVTTGKNLTILEGSSINIALDASDIDGDVLSLNIVQQPTNGELVLSESSMLVSYIPNPNYLGEDTFTFKVNDGQVDSNISTVLMNIIAEPVTSGISNPVSNSAITVNGIIGDWSSLDFFTEDPNDVEIDTTNIINWLKAGLAHSDDKVYLVYQNQGPINPPRSSGSSIDWGWQTYLDVDSDSNTGFKLNNQLGAEYLIEGHHVYQYAGNGTTWNWINLGRAESRYIDNVVEFSFPRAWLTPLADVRVAFYGNNGAFGSNTVDTYPDQGSFEYSFAGVGEFGELVEVSSQQRSLGSSPESHQPKVAQPASLNENNDAPSPSGSKGGSFSWMLLLVSLFMICRRKIHQSTIC